jgi:hypothetical protein
MSISAKAGGGCARSSEMTMTDHGAKLRILDDLDAPSMWSDIEVRQPTAGRAWEPASWRRRLGTATVAIAIGLAGVLVAVKALDPAARSAASLDTRTWSSHDIPALHLAFDHPPEWRVQPFDELVGHAGFVGSVVSNVDQRFRHPDLGPNEFTSAWDLRDVPEDAVVISIEQVDAIGYPDEQEDTQLPLDLSRAQRSEGGAEDRYFDRGWVQLWLPFIASGRFDSVFVWFGPEATDHDREVARRIVASIRFPT